MKRKRGEQTRAQENAIAEVKLVETVNAQSGDAFFDQFLEPQALSALSKMCQTDGLALVCKDAFAMTDVQLALCLKLIEETSARDYKTSEIKWSPVSKKKEMKLPDMKYILLLEAAPGDESQDHPPIAGFVSFMVTYEDSHEVLYVYEVHFATRWRGRGMGSVLMSTVEEIGRTVGLEKAMLTVFRANQRAFQWYIRLHYSEDEYSPGPRKLRNGTVKQPSYSILSKSLR